MKIPGEYQPLVGAVTAVASLVVPILLTVVIAKFLLPEPAGYAGGRGMTKIVFVASVLLILGGFVYRRWLAGSTSETGWGIVFLGLLYFTFVMLESSGGSVGLDWFLLPYILIISIWGLGYGAAAWLTRNKGASLRS